jgi:predicted permease
MAARQPNVLDAAAISALSRLTFWVFQPAFLLCSVSRTIVNASNGGLATRFLMLMPLTAILQIGLGGMAGMLLTKFQSFSDNDARAVRMCTTFANSGPLPLIFADALFGSNAGVLGEVAACVSFYLLVWSPLFWSYGRVIVGTYGSKSASRSKLQRFVEETRKLLSPPVLGSILGVVVGGVPIFRSLFFSGGILSPVWGSLQTLGTAYLPAALLVLAGSLIGPGGVGKTGNAAKDGTEALDRSSDAAVENGQINGDKSLSTGSTNPSARMIISILVSRFLLAPVLSFGLLGILSKVGLLGPAGTRARAVVTYVLLCEGCMPPNQNSVIMLQLEGLKERAQTMAKLLTIIYSIAVLPVTILLSACLAKSSIISFL